MRGFPSRPNNVVQTDQAGRGTADPGVFIIAACERHRRARPSRADGCWDRSDNHLVAVIVTRQEENADVVALYSMLDSTGLNDDTSEYREFVKMNILAD